MPDLTFIAFIFITSFVVGLSGALQPGPLLMLDIAESARRGFWAGPLLVAGHGIAEAGMVLLLALGLSAIFQGKTVAAVVSIIGGGYLIWMGYRIVRSAGSLSLRLNGQTAGRAVAMAPVWTGLWASVTNPGWLVWWATIGASYTLLALRGGFPALGSFYVGHVLSDLSWYSLVSLIVASGRRIISDRLYRGIVGVSGLLVLLIGGYFLIDGIVTAIGG